MCFRFPASHQNLAVFFTENVYHVFNRTNHKEPLFLEDKDRLHFLNLYKKYIAPYVNTFAYCILPNHFHIMFQIKPEDEFQAVFEHLPQSLLSQPQLYWIMHPHDPKDIHGVLERQFTRLFTAYAMAFNRKYHRSGNLFYRPFKRVCVKNEMQMLHLVWYIHHNPQKHGIWKPFSTYKWSSFTALISNQPTMLCRDIVHEMFNGKEQFLEYHQIPPKEPPEDWDSSMEI